MEGKKFSSSKRVVIYVRDLLSRYQPDAFRYFVAAAGPENQDSDFTWSEFVRRTNDELVAGWGNLVNRTATLISKNFGEIPKAGELTAEDQAVLDSVDGAFGIVGDLIARHRQKQAIGEAMRVVAEVNKYVSDSEPWKIKDDPERLGTVLHVMAQCVADLNLVLIAVPAVRRQRGRQGARRRRRHRADAAHRGGRRPRRRGAVPDHHRRLHRRTGLGAQADRARHAGRQADADLHQARPVDRGRGARAAARLTPCVRESRAGRPSGRPPTGPPPGRSTAVGSSATRSPGGSSATLDEVLGRRRARPAAVEALHRGTAPVRRGLARGRRVAAGTRQVVVLGAGLDTFAYRNPFPETRVFEVDSRRPARGSRSSWPRPGSRSRQRDLRRRRLRGRRPDDAAGRPASTPPRRRSSSGSAWCPTSAPAVTATLQAIASVPGGEVVFDYTNPVDQLATSPRATAPT